MDESYETDNLLAARILLKNSIQKSRNLAIEIDKTGLRLEERSHNLAFLQSAIKDMACKCSFYEIRGHVNRAIGPAAAVLKVVDVVYSLKDSLETGSFTDLYAYLATIRQLEDSLKLLANNSKLVILWLQDVVQFLANNAASVDDWYVVKVKKALRILLELQGKEESFRQIGGVLSSALDKLERKYKTLLMENTRTEPFSFQTHVIQELQAVTRVLAANNRLDKCLSIYTQARIANLRATFRTLDLDYLDIRLSEFDSVEMIERYVDRWDNHMEFSVRHLLRKEYILCNEVHDKNVSISCFAKISIQCGFLDILKFGTAVTKCKKEAAKLLMLLKIFATLDKLRLDFNEVFVGEFCVEIQNQTRDLVQSVVNGACEILWELSVQVQLQRASSPPLDGSVPRLVRFVTELCNRVVENENRLFLERVLEIHQVWNGVRFEEGLLANEIRSVMKEIEINLETWAKTYEDAALSHVFMMNNHWYLYKNIEGTDLGDLLGRSWLTQRVESVEYYAALYMRESWEKLLVLLCEEDLFLFPGGTAIDRTLVKKRISVFCDSFDGIFQKQSKWILSDESLRGKTCQLVVEAIIPCYRSFMQRYVPETEHEAEIGNNVRHSVAGLENLLGSLFQPKLGKYSSSKCTDIIGLKNNGTNRFSSTPAAA